MKWKCCKNSRYCTTCLSSTFHWHLFFRIC